MNGTNIKFMDIFKFLTFMLIYKRKIKLVHRKLKQCATSATKYFGEQQTTTKFHFHWRGTEKPIKAYLRCTHPTHSEL